MKAPAFQFYVGDFLSDKNVMVMSAALMCLINSRAA